MNETIRQPDRSEPSLEDRAAALREVFAGLRAVAQAATEQGLGKTYLIDLEAPTTDRAREIFQQSSEA